MIRDYFFTNKMVYYPIKTSDECLVTTTSLSELVTVQSRLGKDLCFVFQDWSLKTGQTVLAGDSESVFPGFEHKFFKIPSCAEQICFF